MTYYTIVSRTTGAYIREFRKDEKLRMQYVLDVAKEAIATGKMPALFKKKEHARGAAENIILLGRNERLALVPLEIKIKGWEALEA